MGPEDRARFDEVADALDIKPDPREFFIETAWYLVEMTAIGNRLYTRAMRDDPNLLAAAKAIRAARTAVEKLTPPQRAHLGVEITSPSRQWAKFTPRQRAMWGS